MPLDTFPSRHSLHLSRYCRRFTWLHAIFGVPDGKAVPVQVFLALPMDFKMHLHLPVSEVTWLQEKERGCEIRVSLVPASAASLPKRMRGWRGGTTATSCAILCPSQQPAAPHAVKPESALPLPVALANRPCCPIFWMRARIINPKGYH